MGKKTVVEPYIEDCKALLSEIKEQDKLLRLKRRWLMGLSLSEREQKRMKKLDSLLDKSIPETLLREDDIYYDNIKIFVEKGFGVDNFAKENYLVVEDSLQLRNSYGRLKNLSSLLDEMTNNGLSCFADLVTDGSVEYYEETRLKMKNIINEYLPTFLDEGNTSFQMRKEKSIHLLKNPKYFRGNHAGLCSPTEAFSVAAVQILNRLEELPLQALSAMHRKLKGKSGYIPRLERRQSSKKRDLIGPVRNCCMKMLSKLGERDVPQEPLVKALSVADLSLKLILGHPSIIEFQKFSPEIEALQKDIAKAIRLINSEKKVSIVKLEALCKKLHQSPDINFDFSKRSLRFAIRNLFIEYLVECNDMDGIPEYLLEALAEINNWRTSSWSSSKEDIEEEVECLLGLSAQTKQIVWDLNPELEVDLDFSDAYMEDLKESDDNEEEEEVQLSQSHKFRSSDFSELTESMGEINPVPLESPVSLRKVDGVSSLLSPNSTLKVELETMHISERDSAQSHEFSNYYISPESKLLNSPECSNRDERLLGSLGRSIWPDLHALPSPANQNQSEFCSTPSGLGSKGGHKVEGQETLNDLAENVGLPSSGPQTGGVDILQPRQCTNRNKYLLIQKACDATAMAMYDVIGNMLNEFARDQHLDLAAADVSYLRSHPPRDSEGT